MQAGVRAMEAAQESLVLKEQLGGREKAWTLEERERKRERVRARMRTESCTYFNLAHFRINTFLNSC